MPAVDDKLTNAAMRVISRDRTAAADARKVAELDLEARVDALIKAHDAPGIFALMPQIALQQQDVTAAQVLRQKIKDEFRGVLSMKDFDKALQAERKKLRSQVRGPLPCIKINDRPLREIVQDSLDALRAANDPPQLFSRSGEVVYVAHDENGRPSIAVATHSHLRGRLDRAANYVVESPVGQIQKFPPDDAVKDIMALGPAAWGFPPLTAITETPSLRPDGTIISTPGYDAASGVYYSPAPGFATLPVPDEPTADDVDAAISMIDEAIGEFPFTEDGPDGTSASRTNMLALLLTPILRNAIAGSVPLAVIDAPKAGTGKTLLVDVLSLITTGNHAALFPWPHSEKEVQATIVSALVDGRSLMAFDNFEGTLRSANLAMAVTSKVMHSRILGVTKTIAPENRATWVLNGNNVSPSGDMARRCYHIRLDARSSTPFGGRRFRHPNLTEWVKDHRPQLVHALLVIARAWYALPVGARPDVVDTPIGSFESWHRTLAGIMHYAQVPSFLANLDEFRGQDEVEMQWQTFLEAVHERFGSASWTVARLVDQFKHWDDVINLLPSSLAEVADKGRSAEMRRALGYALAKRRDTRYGERQVRVVRGEPDGHTKCATWRIEIEPVREG